MRFLWSCLLAVMVLAGMGCEEFDGNSSDNIGQALTNNDGGQTAAAPAPKSSGGGGGSGEFLWKPVSEGDGKLVILLPNSYRKRVTKCVISNDAGGANVVEQGRFHNDTHNGMRVHYRFSKVGRDYGDNIFTVAFLTDGSTKSWAIRDGASRTTY